VKNILSSDRPVPFAGSEPLDGRREILHAMGTISSRFMRGKEDTVRLAFIALLSGGHLLLEDIPGLGKTTLALALANALDLSFGRIQCTSDLLPSDITGLSIFDREENRFRFIPGPVFSHVLLADEINRAMPRTQSALLEAMEERRVTIEGTTHDLPDPFLVIATQNPCEYVGTYSLPESQMDRFLIVTGLGYPPEDIEKGIIRSGGLRDEIRGLAALVGREDILRARRAVRERIYLSEKITDYIYCIVAATREHPLILTGISTRGAIHLAEAARAAAYLEGREYVLPEDVRDLAGATGAHRLLLRPESHGHRKGELFESILKDIPLPLA